ncbi:MAG: hypothetical protein K6F44_07190 [Lachnospiraceae bacterium]|nr:hypothetical protein [Lachnospiraceae bacterium]
MKRIATGLVVLFAVISLVFGTLPAESAQAAKKKSKTGITVSTQEELVKALKSGKYKKITVTDTEVEKQAVNKGEDLTTDNFVGKPEEPDTTEGTPVTEQPKEEEKKDEENNEEKKDDTSASGTGSGTSTGSGTATGTDTGTGTDTALPKERLTGWYTKKPMVCRIRMDPKS